MTLTAQERRDLLNKQKAESIANEYANIISKIETALESATLNKQYTCEYDFDEIFSEKVQRDLEWYYEYLGYDIAIHDYCDGSCFCVELDWSS